MSISIISGLGEAFLRQYIFGRTNGADVRSLDGVSIKSDKNFLTISGVFECSSSTGSKTTVEAYACINHHGHVYTYGLTYL